MATKGPVVTAGAVVAVFGGLLAANAVVNDSPPSQPAAATTPIGPASSAAVSAAAATAASGRPSAPSAATPVPFAATADFAGRVERAGAGPIALSIVVKGERATAYACDGATVEVWLAGTARGGIVDLTGRDSSALAGRHDGGAVVGTLRLGGHSWNFSATAVRAPGGAYVYASEGIRSSWTVDAENNVTGVRRGLDGVASPAGPLDPASRTAVVDGRTVTVIKVEGDDDVA